MSTIAIRVYCGACDLETEFFKAVLDPNDISTLAHAEARVDREIGEGKVAECRSCGGPTAIVRTYVDEFLIEELSVTQFTRKHGPTGEENWNHL